MKRHLLLPFLLMICMGSRGQWTSDPMVNTMAMGTQEDLLFPKQALTPQGTYYISCWKTIANPDTNFNFWLQLVDQDGYPKWGADGLRISNKPCRTWVSDYTLVSDAAGNALIAIEDMRDDDYFSTVVAYKTSPEGLPLWGTEGVTIYHDTIQSTSPILCILNSGNIIVAWDGVCAIDSTPYAKFIMMQKLSPNGTLLWSQPVAVTEGDSTAMFPKLLPTGADDFILVYQKRVGDTTFGGYYYTWIFAQRFGSNGQAVWPQKARICDLAGDSCAYLPYWFELNPIPDSKQGLFVSWHDNRNKNDFYNVFVQHVDSSGNLIWPLNGLAVSETNLQYDRVHPALAFDPVSEELVTIWNEDHAQGIYSAFGLVAQRFAPNGERKWGDLGKILVDYAMDTVWYVYSARSTPDRASILLVDKFYEVINPPDTLVYFNLIAMKIDSMGNSLWSPEQRVIAGTEGTKFYPMMTGFSNGMYVISWGENRDDPFHPVGSVFLQNVHLDGSLGPLGIATPAPGDADEVTVVPNPSGEKSSLVFIKDQNSPIYITLYNSAGMQVRSFSYHPEPGCRSLDLSAVGLPGGIYFVRVTTSGKTMCLRWVVL